MFFCFERVIEDVYILYAYRTFSRGHIPCDNAHGGRFSGPVGTEKAENITLIQLKGNILDCYQIAVVLSKIVNVYHIRKDPGTP